MPYEGEFAQHKSLQRLVRSEKVQQLLGTFEVRESISQAELLAAMNCVDLPVGVWKPDWVVAIDGSYAAVPIQNGFPGAEAAYVTVASVMIDVEKLRDLDKYRPIDPVAFRKTREAESIDAALPGCNIVCQGLESAPASLRHALYDIFQDKRAFTDGESLLETYQILLAHKPQDHEKQSCPYGEDCPHPDKPYSPRPGYSTCACSQRKPLYSTDALRIHDGMNPAGSNGAMYMEIMQVWERIWVVHVLRNMEARGWLGTMKRLAFVLDGPLAVFGHPAWLSRAIYKELSRLNVRVREATGGMDLLLLGVEKSGAFAQHLNMLDQEEGGAQGKLPPRFTALLTDDYIKRNIVFSTSGRAFGRQTYFGRKFFYKTSNGSLIAAQLPFLDPDHEKSERAEITQYPRLQDALTILEELASSRYRNAVGPLVEAHAEAAIPLNLGRKVLENLARQLMRPTL